MKRNIAALMLGLALTFSPSCLGIVWADGYPDQPIKKSVRKVKAPRPVKTVKKTAPKKKAAPKPVAKATPTPLQQGIALVEQERYGAAQPLLRNAIMQNRRSAAAWYWYGVCHEKTGRFYEAQYFYSKAIECDPAFEPLSRVVAWPNNGEKTPVWDPKRPARVYPVATQSGTGTNGLGIIPPGSPQSAVRPTRPNIDPELPKVPTYIPPEPGASPLDGDAWRPSVYVPPTMSEAALEYEEGDVPTYIPPESPKGYIISHNEPAVTGSEPVYQPPMPNQPMTSSVVAYQPPDRPRQAMPTVQTEQQKEEKKSAARGKTVKQDSGKNKKAVKPAATKKTSPKPKSETKAVTPAQPQPQTNVTPRVENESDIPPLVVPTQPQVQPQLRVEELPPVGQTMPEGTVEAPSMPPVRQRQEGNDNGND